jgi:transcriptional regulator with XRE-family HTH domain
VNTAREKIAHTRPAQIVARRVREARKSRGWSQGELAEQLRAIGYPKTRETLTKLESGHNRNITVDDLFALAVALGVNPVHLLAPLEDDVPVAMTEQVQLPAWVVREWVAGELLWLPMLPEIDLTQIPESKLAALIFDDLNRRMGLDPLSRSLMHDELSARSRRLAKQIHKQPKEKDE